jgi:glutamine synthetase
MTNRLRAIFCDHLSLIRGKYLPASNIADGDTNFCRTTFGVHFDKDLLPAPGAMMMEGLPDMELRWQADDIRNSWHDGTKIVIGDLYGMDGAPLPMCGRAALKRAIAAWNEDGLTPMIGIELEAFAFQKDADGNLIPYDAPGAIVYGTGPGTDPLGFNDAIWEAAEKLGFQLDMITAEYDAPQFEYTLTFDNALKAVDDIVLFRQMAREIALGFGVILTFLPKPLAEAGGSGMHINFSFQDPDGNNALPKDGESGPDHLSDLASGCIAGLVHHHKGLAGLLAPTANSYKRLQPASLSGYWKNWGGDHRNVTTRVSEEGGTKTRLEHRMADASANPYTAAAAVLQAARLGVKNGYALPARETGDGFELTDAKEGVATDLNLAMDDLEADTALREAVGETLVDNQIFMRRAEVEKTADLDDVALRDFYINYI